MRHLLTVIYILFISNRDTCLSSTAHRQTFNLRQNPDPDPELPRTLTSSPGRPGSPGALTSGPGSPWTHTSSPGTLGALGALGDLRYPSSRGHLGHLGQSGTSGTPGTSGPYKQLNIQRFCNFASMNYVTYID